MRVGQATPEVGSEPRDDVISVRLVQLHESVTSLRYTGFGQIYRPAPAGAKSPLTDPPR
jgi:hypothetical protein